MSKSVLAYHCFFNDNWLLINVALKSFFLALIFTANIANAADLALVDSAREQVGITTQYDSSYSRLDYPNGDVAMSKGVCTDVVIRALRDAHSLDLQKLVHEDMKKHFSLYPKIWGLKKPDSNIDHRRVPNLQTYFKRHWQSLPTSTEATDYLAGDVVSVMLPHNLLHIMIVSNNHAADNTPLVIHNIGNGTQEENSLFQFKITGHYRLPN